MSTSADSRILFIQYANPAAYPCLEHSSRMLAKEGWKVLFLGTRIPEVAALKFPFHKGITVRQIPFCPGGWRQKLHYLWFCLWVAGWFFRWRPRWIYISDPISAPAGLLLSGCPGVKVIYHEHDSPSARSGLGISIFMKLVLWARQRLARTAQRCLLPNTERAARFSPSMGNADKVLCVWNCPVQEEVVPPRSSFEAGVLRLIYHGSIIPARLPLTVLEALAERPSSVNLRVIGYETVGHRGYVEQMHDRIRKLGIEKRVEILSPVTREEVLRNSLDCHLGLSLMPKRSEDVNLQFMIGASNKPFDYMACGLAVLVSDLPDWTKMYVDPGFGLACNPDDPRSIADAFQWFLEHPEKTREMGERGRQRILEEWNYERQFSPVLKWLVEAAD